MPMIVATTALKSFWGDRDPDAFLGRWCFKFPNDVDRPDLVSRVVDYPFARFGARREAYDFCLDLKEALLADLTGILNDYHGIDRSPEYWDVLLCAWLHRVVMTAHHHRTCLRTAREQFPDMKIFGPLREAVAPTTTSGVLYRELWGSRRHLAIFAELADAMGIDCERIASSEPDWPPSPVPDAVVEHRRGGLQDIVGAIRGKLADVAADRAACVLYNAPVGVAEALELGVRSGFRIARLPLRSASEVQWPAPDTSARESLARLLEKSSCGSAKFSALARVLAHNLPISLLEGFGVLQDYARSQFPSRTDTVASGMAWVGDDGFLLWAAATKERGGRLVSLQHGGSYGIREMLSGAELVEVQIADKVLSWGDHIQVGKTTESLPVLPRFFVRRGASRGDRLLYLGGSAGLIFRYGFMSCVDSNDAIGYIDRQCAFFAALPEEMRRQFLVRLHPLGFGWDEKERIRLSFPNLQFDDHSIALTQRLSQARLAVADNMNTSFLQAMGSGIPTVLVWDREMWSLNRVGAADFERLQDVGVFVDSPEVAAETVRKHAEDAFDWWTSEPVAGAVREFLRGHFRTDRNWLEPWRKQLLN